MSNVKQWIYEVIPESSYPVIRNCPGCGKKTVYHNTNRFRVNASGSKIDVWLIYHCEICKHTLNLAIYERRPIQKMSRIKYQKFLNNDQDLATAYGRDKRLFAKNKAVIDADSMKYQLNLVSCCCNPGEESHIIIKNPWELKLRTDKLLSELLKLTRSREKEMEKHGYIVIDQTEKKEIIVMVRLPFEPM